MTLLIADPKLARCRRGRASPVFGIVVIAVALLPMLFSARPAAQTNVPEEAGKFVVLKLEGDCDAKNKSLWLTNTHTFKTVAVTVRWHADGGKDLQNEVFLTPNSVREMGCAVTAAIVVVKFADF